MQILLTLTFRKFFILFFHFPKNSFEFIFSHIRFLFSSTKTLHLFIQPQNQSTDIRWCGKYFFVTQLFKTFSFCQVLIKRLYIRVFPKYRKLAYLAICKIEKSVTSIYMSSKHHSKCKFALNLIHFSTVSNLYSLEVVQNCQCCQLCV